MKKLIFLLFIQLLFTYCSSIHKNEEQSYSGKIKEYEQIISGLKKNAYVLYHKPIIKQKLSEEDFKQDSLIYYRCYQDFFAQDYSLVEWLLTFEKDTIRKDLWHQSLNPLSSTIEECHLSMRNSRSAIVLIENYLNGKGFICYACHVQDRRKCNENRYRFVKGWLTHHKDLFIEDLRKQWEAKNYH